MGYKPENKLKSHAVTVKLSKEELDRITKKAEKKGVKVSTYIRLAALRSRL